MTDALANRTQLPDALRVLLEDYPRAGWEADPGFDPLTRFWLDRHLMFRKMLDEMRKQADQLLDRKEDPDRFRAATSRYGSMFVNGLHEHHSIEDQYYFPKLSGNDPRLLRGFEILDKDHHALDAYLASLVDSANVVLAPIEDRDVMQDKVGLYRADLVSLEKLLNRHLVDEEELVVPIILRYGAPATE